MKVVMWCANNVYFDNARLPSRRHLNVPELPWNTTEHMTQSNFKYIYIVNLPPSLKVIVSSICKHILNVTQIAFKGTKNQCMFIQMLALTYRRMH